MIYFGDFIIDTEIKWNQLKNFQYQFNKFTIIYFNKRDIFINDNFFFFTNVLTSNIELLNYIS